MQNAAIYKYTLTSADTERPIASSRVKLPQIDQTYDLRSQVSKGHCRRDRAAKPDTDICPTHTWLARHRPVSVPVNPV